MERPSGPSEPALALARAALRAGNPEDGAREIDRQMRAWHEQTRREQALEADRVATSKAGRSGPRARKVAPALERGLDVIDRWRLKEQVRPLAALAAISDPSAHPCLATYGALLALAASFDPPVPIPQLVADALKLPWLNEMPRSYEPIVFAVKVSEHIAAARVRLKSPPANLPPDWQAPLTALRTRFLRNRLRRCRLCDRLFFDRSTPPTARSCDERHKVRWAQIMAHEKTATGTNPCRCQLCDLLFVDRNTSPPTARRRSRKPPSI